MNVLDLFSGIGGFSLGLERAGMRTVAFCEIGLFQRSILARHWPGIPIYDDVRSLTADRLSADGISVDVICGGFPCQDISTAGPGAGISGARSGLWKEYARIIGELRPRYVIVENVAALLGRGLDVVLGDLAALRFDAEWHCIPASAVGAPHRRDRLWLVAYPTRERPAEEGTDSKRFAEWVGGGGEVLADAASGEAWSEKPSYRCGIIGAEWQNQVSQARGRDGSFRGTDWHSEPSICRVVDGISSNVDRVAGLGNAVIPQIPEIIGRAIMRAA